MTTLRRRMREDLQQRGLAPKTQECYIDKQVAESTFRVRLYGSRFFYERTLQRPWPLFALVRSRKSQKRPSVLSPQAVRCLLALVKNPKARMCLRLIYACGWRLPDGTQLQLSDLDAPRMLVPVRQGKGGKARCVPLAPRLLEWWRAYWQRQRPRPWLFPARHRSAPLAPTSLQKPFNAVGRQSGMANDAASPTLRHSYATHLVERGGRCGLFRSGSATRALGPPPATPICRPRPWTSCTPPSMPSWLSSRAG
jgi:integrase/recombinase XerD